MRPSFKSSGRRTREPRVGCGNPGRGAKLTEEAEKARHARNDRKQVVKEGLSECFMFSVEGTKTVKNGWSKRMPAVDALRTPFDIVYRMRSHQYGAGQVRSFVWRHDTEHELGGSPLPDGGVRT